MGILLEAYRPSPLLLRDPLMFNCNVQLKTKTKAKEFILVKHSDYDGDFYLKWNPDYHGIFHVNIGADVTESPTPQSKFCKKQHLFYCLTPNECLVDIKGTFDNPKQIPFSRTQQLIATTGTFVQKTIPLGKKGVFARTFAPKEYLYTPVTKKKRLAFKSLTEFLLQARTIVVRNEKETAVN